MMRIYRITFLALILLSIRLSAQADTFNQFDAKGRKTGYWKCFLDEHAMPIDSANAYLFGYEFFDNGKPVVNYFLTKKNLSHYKIIYEGKLPSKGNPIPINGTLKWFDTKYGHEELSILDEFENGYPTIYKECTTLKNETVVFHMMDFTKRYNNQPGSFYEEYYYGFIIAQGKEKLTRYWNFKENNKWKEFKIK